MNAELVFLILRLVEMGLLTTTSIIDAAKREGATDAELAAARADLLAIKARRQPGVGGPGEP